MSSNDEDSHGDDEEAEGEYKDEDDGLVDIQVWSTPLEKPGGGWRKPSWRWRSTV